MCMRRTFVSRSIGPRGGVPGHGMRTIIERAFTAHKLATARYVGGWRRLWAAGLLCALAGTASGYVQASSSSGNFTPVTRADSRAFRQRGSTTAWRGSSARTDSTSSLTPRWPGVRIAPRRAGSGMLRRVLLPAQRASATRGRRLALRPHRTLAPRTRQQHARPDTRCHLRGCDCGRRLAQGDRRAHGITQSFAIERLTPPRRVHELTLLR